MSITITPFDAKAAYVKEIGLFVLGIQHEHGVPTTLEQQPDLSNVERTYITPGGNFWVALDDGKLVGTIALINAGGGVGVLRKMFAAPAYRGAPHRLGQQLLNTLLPWARQQGFKKIYLGTVDVLKAAQRFYEKNGFTQFPEELLPVAVCDIKMPNDNKYYAMELAA